MASAATILEWLKEAGAYAEKREDLVGISGMLIDIVVGPHALGVRVRRPDQREFRSVLWEELEVADNNPIPGVIDATIEAVEKECPIDLWETPSRIDVSGGAENRGGSDNQTANFSHR
jgi:hypothetical protein